MVEFEPIERPKEIYKYESLSTAELIIFNQTIKFTFPGKFNDPFDCNLENVYFKFSERMDPLVIQEIDILKKEFGRLLSDEMLLRAYQESLNNKLRNAAVSCFSLRKDNTLMWSHYADKHSGICLQFDFLFEKPFLDVKIALEGTVDYGFGDPINYLEDKKAGLWRAFLTKSIDWQYEKELRFLTLQGEQAYKYKPEFLRKIIFGINCKKSEIEGIISCCKQQNLLHLKFEKANKHEGNIVFSGIGAGRL